jgi:hypothetical protein
MNRFCAFPRIELQIPGKDYGNFPIGFACALACFRFAGTVLSASFLMRLLCIPSLDAAAPLRYFVITRERRLIQLMQIDSSSCFVREVTEA